MKIKLISPKMSLRPMDSEFKRVMAPSLALLTLAALTPEEHEIIFEDENVQRISYDDRPDLVGITVNVDTSCRAYEIADYYRNQGINVILGGIHVSANPDEALEHADSICIGEAEEVWSLLIKDAANGNLQKRYCYNGYSEFKSCPVPRWGSINQSKYLYTNIVCTSRGCPYQCEFCYNSCDYRVRKYQNRPIDEVIHEIFVLKNKHVMFIDDNFIGNIHWTKQFLRQISSLGLKWNAAVSANIGEHLELLDLMKESGCKSLFIGLESINQKSIQSVNKVQNHIESYEKMIHEIHARGIMVNGSLAFGFDYDYPDVFQNTIEWLVRNKVETMTAHILTPYPGTKLYQKFVAENRIFDFNWSHYNTANVVFVPKNMTPEELYQGYLWIYQEFYSFRNIIKRMPESYDQILPYLLFALGYRKFGKVTSGIAKMGLMSKLGSLAGRLSYGLE